MRVVFVPRSVEIQPLFSELESGYFCKSSRGVMMGSFSSKAIQFDFETDIIPQPMKSKILLVRVGFSR